MASKKISELAEATVIQPEDFLMVIQNGTNKRMKVSTIRGATNLSDHHLDLTAEDGMVYRAAIDSKGMLSIMPLESELADLPSETDNANYHGLIIHQMYGGGSTSLQPSVSHSFVELYNTTAKEINLKGLYLFYKERSDTWKKLPLKGIVPPYHSFLVRGQAQGHYPNPSIRCDINQYDQAWDIAFSNQGFSMYLCIGAGDVDDQPLKYRLNELGQIVETYPRYIDLLGAGGKDSSQTITAYEGNYWHCLDEHTAIRRRDFSFGHDNKEDAEPIDYRRCNFLAYGPRSLQSGAWDLYVTKTKLNPNIPNLLNIRYTESNDRERLFTWQSTMTDQGYLRYRLAGVLAWKEVESIRSFVRYHDQEVIHHCVTLQALAPGVYEYQAGEEGAWSDIQTFTVKDYRSTDHIKVLWTTDQQLRDDTDAQVWKVALRNISDWENFDFHINTGDLTQHGTRCYEWLNYYKYSGIATRQVCHMTTNGDQSSAMDQNSYAFDLGFAHFVCLNANESMNTQQIQEQCEWLDQHLGAVRQRPIQPRWIICYMHLSPFTLTRPKCVQAFIPIFEAYRIPLVLCGHQHAYSRSKAIHSGYNGSDAYNDYLQVFDLEEVISKGENIKLGTHYIMCQATGAQLQGKEEGIRLPSNLGGGTPWWYQTYATPTQPCYGMIDISYDSIQVKATMIQDVFRVDETNQIVVNDYGHQSRYEFDSLIINHSDRS